MNEQFPYNSNSNYNSLQVTVTKHLTKNLGFLAAYTFSKAMGYIDANGPGAYYTSVQDYYNRKLDRSITEFSTPHEFKLTWVYETPFGKGRRCNLGWANPILGGWQVRRHSQLHFGTADPGELLRVQHPGGIRAEHPSGHCQRASIRN